MKLVAIGRADRGEGDGIFEIDALARQVVACARHWSAKTTTTFGLAVAVKASNIMPSPIPQLANPLIV